MKIPTVFEIEKEREYERMENSRSGIPATNGYTGMVHEGYQVSALGMGMGPPSDQGYRSGNGGASGQNFNFSHQKNSSIPSKGFPSVRGLISISEGVNEPEAMAH